MATPSAAEPHQFHDTEEIVFSPALAQIPWLRHGSTTRNFSPAQADRNEELRSLRRSLRIEDSAPIVRGDQRHTDVVGIADEAAAAKAAESGFFVYPSTDAIVTRVPGIMIAILTADCAPLFLADPQERVIGVVHAGWRGSFARIAEKAVTAMVGLGADKSRLIAWIGPMIGGCCYEVSEELAQQFVDEFSDHPTGPSAFAKGRLLDLQELNAQQLIRAGLHPDHVSKSGLCTMHRREQFYSYRADQGTTGRIISAMSIAS
jgi:polyphenol oxidase